MIKKIKADFLESAGSEILDSSSTILYEKRVFSPYRLPLGVYKDEPGFGSNDLYLDVVDVGGSKAVRNREPVLGLEEYELAEFGVGLNLKEDARRIDMWGTMLCDMYFCFSQVDDIGEFDGEEPVTFSAGKCNKEYKPTPFDEKVQKAILEVAGKHVSPEADISEGFILREYLGLKPTGGVTIEG